MNEAVKLDRHSAAKSLEALAEDRSLVHRTYINSLQPHVTTAPAFSSRLQGQQHSFVHRQIHIHTQACTHIKK